MALTTAAFAGLVATSATRNPSQDRRLYFYNNERAIAAMVLARSKVDGSGMTHWHGTDFGAWPRKKGAGMVLGQHVVGEVTTAGDELSFLATLPHASVYLVQMPGLHRVRLRCACTPLNAAASSSGTT